MACMIKSLEELGVQVPSWEPIFVVCPEGILVLRSAIAPIGSYHPYKHAWLLAEPMPAEMIGLGHYAPPSIFLLGVDPEDEVVIRVCRQLEGW